jgi:hypothetical protein
MERILTKLYNSSLKEVLRYLGKRLRSSVPHAISDANVNGISAKLRKQFEIYRTSNLKGVSPKNSDLLQSKIGVIDTQTEGYSPG